MEFRFGFFAGPSVGDVAVQHRIQIIKGPRTPHPFAHSLEGEGREAVALRPSAPHEGGSRGAYPYDGP